jgi:hypothetical protein
MQQSFFLGHVTPYCASLYGPSPSAASYASPSHAGHAGPYGAATYSAPRALHYKVIDAWISLLIVSSSLAMLFLTSPLFPLPRRSLPPLPLTSFLTTSLLSMSPQLSLPHACPRQCLPSRLHRCPRQHTRHPQCPRLCIAHIAPLAYVSVTPMNL